MPAIHDFIHQCWAQHQEDATGVAERLPQALALVEDETKLADLAALIVHVLGEHLGKWSKGIELLELLTEREVFNPASAAGKSVYRALAILAYSAGERTTSSQWERLSYSGDRGEEASERIQILAPAATALAGQHLFAEAAIAFQEAHDLAEYDPGKEDPAARALAIAANNIAVILEELGQRTPSQTKLMIQAAEAARRFWEVAGTWIEVERAEYRLAKAYASAGRAESALRCAKNCLRICQENNSVPFERFHAYEALAVAELAAGNRARAKAARDHAESLIDSMKDLMRPVCQRALARLDELLFRIPEI